MKMYSSISQVVASGCVCGKLPLNPNEFKIKMASSNMCVRSMSKIVRLTRAAAYPRHGNRFCTTVSGTRSKEEPIKPEVKEVDGEAEQALKQLTEDKEKLQINFDELQDKYKRSLAETENVRMRLQKQVDDAKLFGIQGFCKDLLEVADILQQATESTPVEEVEKNQHLKALFEGLTMTNTQMLKVFSKHGLEQINPEIGEKFDPFLHEAMFQVPAQGDSQAGTVAVKQKLGYKLHERTLRPALVGVFKES